MSNQFIGPLLKLGAAVLSYPLTTRFSQFCLHLLARLELIWERFCLVWREFTLKKQIQNLENQNSALSGRVDHLTKDNKELKSRLGKAESFSNTLGSLVVELSKLTQAPYSSERHETEIRVNEGTKNLIKSNLGLLDRIIGHLRKVEGKKGLMNEIIESLQSIKAQTPFLLTLLEHRTRGAAELASLWKAIEAIQAVEKGLKEVFVEQTKEAS
jgi:hypothetical protein